VEWERPISEKTLVAKDGKNGFIQELKPNSNLKGFKKTNLKSQNK